MGKCDTVMPHAEHRKRMRERYEKDGIFSFKEHEVLEMLLFHSLPRRNTNEVSHRLLERFGSLKGVLSARAGDLQLVEGIGRISAEYLCMLGGVFRRITSDMMKDVPFDSKEKSGVYASLMMGVSETGSVLAIYLDKDSVRIGEEWLTLGKNGDPAVVFEAVAKSAGELCAKGLIVAHEHRDEPDAPSPDDLIMTEAFLSKIRSAGVREISQIIVSDKGYTYI